VPPSGQKLKQPRSASGSKTLAKPSSKGKAPSSTVTTKTVIQSPARAVNLFAIPEENFSIGALKRLSEY
jgi:hypothetical protein